jgi:hypothetical protein
MRLAQRLFALVVVVAAAFGFAGVARTTASTGDESGGGTLVSAWPSFSTGATDQNSGDEPFVISVAPDPPTVGGALSAGYSLTISPSGGSLQRLEPGVVASPTSTPPSPAPTASSSSPPASTPAAAAAAPSTSAPASTPAASAPSSAASTPATSSLSTPPPSSKPAAAQPAHPAKPQSRPRSDKKHPAVNAFSVSGTLLHSLRLRFRVSDDSGKAALALGLYKGKRTITWHTTALKLVSPHRTYSLTWKPQALGDYLFCVGAADAAGNRRSDCAKVTIHR